MREVDDVEQPEDDREPEAEHRVERAVDQPEQQLPEQRLRWNADEFEHGGRGLLGIGSRGTAKAVPPGFRGYCTSGQPPSASGRKASAPGMVATSS